MNKRVLMIAYHYPPMRGSSGIQRALRFSQYLSAFGWDPIILTAHPRAYADTSTDQLSEIPPQVIVERAFALDTSRHLSVKGRYLGALAIPDRWATWWLGGVISGRRLIRQYKPAAIWSTYPIATAHKIGLSLARSSGLPWIADFRDPMAQPGYPEDPRVWQAFKRIETDTLRQAARVTFTTPGAIRTYRKNYPEIPAERYALLENGYDEDVFTRAERGLDPAASHQGGPIRLLHSGIVYPSERDPRAFFDALALLKRSGALSARRLQIILRASGNDAYLRLLLAERGIEDLVRLEPPVPYQDALAEMLTVDGLLILQAANCNDQIPAKLYEYLRAGRPVLGLTDPAGDTAATLRAAGIATLAPLDDSGAIATLLAGFLDRTDPDMGLPDSGAVMAASRKGRTADLARMLDEVSSVHRSGGR